MQGFTADYFAVGVTAFEFMRLKRPYVGKDRNVIKAQMQREQVCVEVDQIPVGWSTKSADFVNRCLKLQS